MKAQNKSLIEEGLFRSTIPVRNQRTRWWSRLFSGSVVLATVALIVLLVSIFNSSFGYIAVADLVDPNTLAAADGRALPDQTSTELANMLRDLQDEKGTFYVSTDRLFGLFLDQVAGLKASPAEYKNLTIGSVLADEIFPPEWADRTIFDLRLPQDVDRAERETKARADLALLLEQNVPQPNLIDIVYTDIVRFDLKRSWDLIESIFNYDAIQQYTLEQYPDARLEFHSWLNGSFITSTSSSTALTTGIRVAILGTLWVLAIAMGVSLPLGVGAAIYLEEYSRSTDQPRLIRMLNNFIETNIRNLAGVPSIIYGMLGLAIFVRVLAPLTSGAFLSVTDTDGRTIVSAGLTMALLILPVIIINSQEAIRAVPTSIREASYGLGATKWQTIQRQVLPAAIPGILTGTILSISRAIGETAPLVVVGAATTIFVDPQGPFSKFTVLPIQVYRWTADARPGFRDASSAAIVVLLTLLLLLNLTAIIVRNHYSNRNRRLA